jgi:hypothetical protein
MKKVWYRYCTNNLTCVELNVHKNMTLLPRLASTHRICDDELRYNTPIRYYKFNVSEFFIYILWNTFNTVEKFSVTFIQFSINIPDLENSNFSLKNVCYENVSFTRNCSNIRKSEYLWGMNHSYQRCHSRIGSMAIRAGQTNRKPSYLHCRSRCPYTGPQIAHSRSWTLLEKLPIVQLLKNFPAFYGTRKFITVFTRALHWSLSW